jgi:hypothetical protein
MIRREERLKCRLVSFGLIEIDGRRSTTTSSSRVRAAAQEGAIEASPGRVRAYAAHAGRGGPWSAPLLIVGTGASGALPVTEELYREAAERRVEVVARPTAEACKLLAKADRKSVAAVLHVTC